MFSVSKMFFCKAKYKVRVAVKAVLVEWVVRRPQKQKKYEVILQILTINMYNQCTYKKLFFGNFRKCRKEVIPYGKKEKG